MFLGVLQNLEFSGNVLLGSFGHIETALVDREV